MKQIYNFSAGPACLPKAAIQGAEEAIKNFQDNGISLLEMSHRSTPVINLFEETTNNVRDLLEIPDNYDIIWLQGGASTQFSMVPMNLLPENGYADYIDTGSWSAKAIVECKRVGGVNIIGSSKDSLYSYIPKDLIQSGKSSYLHITSNNTIYGTQFKEYPLVNNDKCFLTQWVNSVCYPEYIEYKRFNDFSNMLGLQDNYPNIHNHYVIFMIWYDLTRIYFNL